MQIIDEVTQSCARDGIVKNHPKLLDVERNDLIRYVRKHPRRKEYLQVPVAPTTADGAIAGTVSAAIGTGSKPAVSHRLSQLMGRRRPSEGGEVEVKYATVAREVDVLPEVDMPLVYDEKRKRWLRWQGGVAPLPAHIIPQSKSAKVGWGRVVLCTVRCG